MKNFKNGSEWSLSKKPKHCDMKRVDSDFHKLSFEDLTTKFQTSVTNGLDPIVAQQLLAKNGPNRIKQYKTNVFVKIVSYFFSG
jgi:hypothetical protein